MPLQLNNQNDGYYDNVYLLNVSTSLYEEIRDLIASGGGGAGSGGITTLIGAGHAVVTGTGSTRTITVDLSNYTDTPSLNSLLNAKQDILTLIGAGQAVVTGTGSTRTITVDLSNYTDTPSLNSLLNAKQDTLTAGNNITINNNTISGVDPLILQLDGVNQNASTLNFVGNNAVLSSGVLNISRMEWQDALTLRYSTSATDKDLTQGSSGELLWNGSEVQLRANAFHQINAAAPLSVSGSNNITIESLWKPSTLSVGAGLNAVASDANGTLQLGLTGTESRAQLSLIDSQGTVRNLTPSITGSLTYNGTTLVDLTYHTNSLGNKQDTLTAGSNITINNNTISAVGDATQNWVTANFLSPLNPGTVGVTAGLSSILGANSMVISVDESSDSRTLFILRDSNNTARNITSNTNGQLLFDNNALATETQLNTKQDTITAGNGLKLTGNQLDTYRLINNTTAASLPIDDIIFSGFNCSEVLNVGTSKYEFKVQPPTNIQYLETGLSGVTLGSSHAPTNARHRIACFEQLPGSGFTAGSYFYGIGLTTLGASAGLGLWGGTHGNLPNQDGVTGTTDPHVNVCANGRVGIGQVQPAYELDVTGDIRATGSVIGATKNFDIQHPDPDKSNMRLRHWCVESDTPGGMVMYRKTIDMTSTTATFEMPDWFEHLSKDVIVMVTPYQHFGSGWGEAEGNTIEIHVTTLGKWHVLITAQRADHCATTMCPQEIEYIPAEPNDNNSGLPPH